MFNKLSNPDLMILVAVYLASTCFSYVIGKMGIDARSYSRGWRDANERGDCSKLQKHMDAIARSVLELRPGEVLEQTYCPATIVLQVRGLMLSLREFEKAEQARKSASKEGKINQQAKPLSVSAIVLELLSADGMLSFQRSKVSPNIVLISASRKIDGKTFGHHRQLPIRHLETNGPMDTTLAYNIEQAVRVVLDRRSFAVSCE